MACGARGHPLNSPSLTATHDDALYALCRSLCSSTACGFPCLMQMPNSWLRMIRFTPLAGPDAAWFCDGSRGSWFSLRVADACLGLPSVIV